MWSSSNTIPELDGKPIEIRQRFADAANAALTKGRTQQEAVFAGITAARTLERKIEKAAAEKLTEEKIKRNTVPLHLQVIKQAATLKIAKESKPVEKAEEVKTVSDIAAEIVDLRFDEEGYLQVKFRSGKTLKTKNTAPRQEAVSQYVTIQNSPVVTETGGNQTYLSEFSDENELDRTMVYSGGVLTRVNYESGNYKILTYNTDQLFRVDYIKTDNKTYRKTFYYNTDGSLASVDYQILDTNVVIPEVNFTGYFVPQWENENPSVQFTGYFQSQYS
jgi:hypothetical protein